MDTKITRFGYIISKKTINDITLNNIRNDLTVKPFRLDAYYKFSKDNCFPLYVENGDYISIPKYYGLEKFGQPKINKLETYLYPTFKMEYLGKLRPHQEIIMKKVMDEIEKNKGGVLIAGCGIGKTNLAIYASCKYKYKTLFVVHKGFLKNQIINRIKSTTNIKKIGIIQRDKVDLDSPFVVAMVQSLAKRDYDDNFFKDFGLIIIDEVHHMAAKNFSRVYQKMSAKYMLGITAERKRTDGLFYIINWYMGPILYAEEQKPNDMVIVKKFHFKTSNTERSAVIKNKYTGEPDRPTMITNLVYIKKRNRFIIKLINNLFDMNKNILILSGRIKQVNLFYHLLKENENTRDNVGKYLGGMSERDLAVSATKKIIIGTYSMAEEGLDIQNLNVIVLCTPKSAVKQSVGRILRKEIYEEHPIVIDIVDNDNAILKRQSTTRDAYYHKQNFNIQNFQIADYQLKNHIMWDDEKSINMMLTKPLEIKKTKNIKKNGPIDINMIDFDD